MHIKFLGVTHKINHFFTLVAVLTLISCFYIKWQILRLFFCFSVIKNKFKYGRLKTRSLFNVFFLIKIRIMITIFLTVFFVEFLVTFLEGMGGNHRSPLSHVFKGLGPRRLFAFFTAETGSFFEPKNKNR